MSATPSSCLLQSLQSNGYVQSVPSHPPNTLTLKRSWSSSCARWLISWWPKHSNYDGVFLHAAHCLMHSTIVHSALLATANYSRTSHIYHISHLTIPTISGIKVFFRFVLRWTRIVSLIKRTQWWACEQTNISIKVDTENHSNKSHQNLWFICWVLVAYNLSWLTLFNRS